MKAAYLLAPGVARYTGKVSRQNYEFNPWAEVDPEDWQKMKRKVIHVTGCCGHPARQMRVFGSEEEIRQGAVGFNR